jgi:23S rRNA G2069 N7-methylase RlmK/C1962 C5-methylase RlmI
MLSPTCAACATKARRIDLIVLDPPKFAPTAAHAERAARAYKDINSARAEAPRAGRPARDVLVLRRDSRRLFQKIVAGAALDAGADAQIVKRLCASADHPVALNFPEGDYLKGLLCESVLAKTSCPNLPKNKAAGDCSLRPCQPRPDGQEVTRRVL